ncbi:hypothetical protein L198_02429 [Cryptococcus wingfieldii CBS 7118]|uniref:Uncharacterized protein n=1 Tax=Cryptococcus wingfieldii CBS 7118 TaxID=1295528 RepID=A0A1E3JRT0_9TREE|nr:hypothetical protein L198_02429 [Cryptococcus wingfieldii CBS 7118]ODO03581.1 hypothetical protein L198_02429 [Cryptococcus wingfieldii CBS 7118]
MLSTSNIGPISQQYSAAATVPLIKSPSLWLPKPVELPTDVHPLPEDITAYFVYPFTLEEHVRQQHPSPHEAIAQRRARLAEVLHQREEEEERKEKDELRRIAPGYNPSSLLVPTSTNHTPSTSISQSHGGQPALSSLSRDVTGSEGGEAREGAGGDPMDDLVARLEEMEAKR